MTIPPLDTRAGVRFRLARTLSMSADMKAMHGTPEGDDAAASFVHEVDELLLALQALEENGTLERFDAFLASSKGGEA